MASSPALSASPKFRRSSTRAINLNTWGELWKSGKKSSEYLSIVVCFGPPNNVKLTFYILGKKMPKAIDLSGQRFSRLVCIEPMPREIKNQNIKWRCACDCGGEVFVIVASLRNGTTRSCGCLVSQRLRVLGLSNFKHGEGHGHKTKEYRAWSGMKERCYSINNDSYHSYGGRGIKVCDAWRNDYMQFLTDMGRAPSGHSLDRIDVNGDYEPGNCRWATVKTQARNKTNTRFIFVSGKKMKAIDVANHLGVYRNEIYVYEKIKKMMEKEYGI